MIKIGQLSPDNVKNLVAEALNMEDDDDKVKSLSTIIHRKTDGIAFFVYVDLSCCLFQLSERN